jgi:acetyltransferase-like isoleucine patch superfamily enzyme
MENRPNNIFKLLVPGQKLQDDWCDFPIPLNMEVGENSVVDTSACFKQFFSTEPLALRIGSNVTIRSSTLATEPNACIKIGDYSYISFASIACSCRISIGNYVCIAGGVNIVDSDFHPISPADRLTDTIAISPVGDKRYRPKFISDPVIIEDEVWIGYNATILKGVRIGRGAIIQPGSVVLQDVPAYATVSGNPGKIINQQHAP